MADPTIPTPLTSGTTDQPNAPQEGEWQDYKPATKAKTDEGWQDYKPAPAVRASTKTPTEKAAENAVITTPPSNIDLIKGFLTDAASQVRHNPMEFAKGVAKAVIPTAQGALPQADSTELDAATKAKLEKEEENPNLAERILEGTSEALHIPQAFKKVQDVVTPYLTPQNSAQQAGSDVGQLTGQMYGAVEMGKGAMGMVRPGTHNPSRVALTRPEPVPQLLVDELNAKQAAFNKAKTDVDVYQHSQAKGAEPPAKVQKAFDKAKKELVEAQFHYNTAKDAIRPKTVKPQPVDHFQGFQQDIDSMAPGAPEQKPINVKGPGEVKPETISQPLTEKPMIVPGQKQLPNNQGRMGVTNMLPEAPLHLPQEVLPSEHSMVKTNVPAKVTEPKTVVVEMRVPKSRYGAPTKTVSAKTPTGVPQVMPVEAPASSMEAEITKNEPKPASPVKPMIDKIGEEVRKGTGGAEDLKPNVPLKEQGTAKEPVKLSSDPRKAALQRAGATDEEISKILARGTKTDPTSKVGASKLAEHFGIDLGQSAVGRGKADAAAGTHISPAEILQKIIDAGHSPSDIAKAVDEGKHLPTASGGSQAATPRLAADIGEWKAPPELGVATAEDVGAKVRAKNPEPAGRGVQTLEQSKALDRRTGSGLQEGQTEHRVGDRRTFDRSKQTAEDNYFKQAVRELGSDATDEAIDKRITELKTKSALEHIKSGKDYAVLTAENPGNKRLSAEENAQRNRALVADLQNRGYEVVPVEGGNKDVEGKTEHSYFVKDIPPKEAAELGRKHGQESVLTTEGLHHLDSDIVDPSDNKNLMTGEDAKKQDYYTKIGDQSFSVPLSSGKPSNLPKGYPKTATMSDAELERAGYSKEDISNGKHLETASGGSQSAGTGTKSAKELPTGDDLIKKYGESSGDPAHTTFILKDGRGVANTGIEHDQMLGGKATDTKPPRERFIAQGNIRVRPRMGTGGRETALSIPESGINTKQLDYIKKMAPQLRSGAVLIEVGKPGGDYRVLPQGEASDEAIGKALKDLAPIVNDKGSPVDESAGAAPAKVKATEEKLPELAEKHVTPEEDEPVMKKPGKKKSPLKNML